MAGANGAGSGPPRPEALPAMFRGQRRRHLVLLVAAGVGQAVAGAVVVLALERSFRSSSGRSAALLLGLVMLGATALGLLRMAERTLAERLGQHYVHQLRGELLRASLARSDARSLGVVVARTTNDLTSIRNWVALGVAPLASGIPLLAGACVVLAAMDPVLAVAAVVPLLVLGGLFAAVAPLAYERSRALRRVRGRLAAQIADTVQAAPAIRAGGGQRRELRRLRRRSAEVVDAAVARARMAGVLRGAAATASGIATGCVVAAGLWRGVPTGTIAAAITVLGILASPVHDLGRVVEYRQMYRAARRILAPILADAAESFDAESAADAAEAADLPRSQRPTGAGRADAVPAVPGALHVRDLTLGDGSRLPDLDLAPGSRVALEMADRRDCTDVMETLAGLHRTRDACVVLDGQDVHGSTDQERRRLVGYAGHGMRLERGTLARAVRYREPDLGDAATADLLRRFGLDRVVERLPRGAATQLRHGGDPLAIPERALVLLARAMVGPPRLLLLDHLDSDLDAGGVAVLRHRLADYPGVVVLASTHPERVADISHRWRPAPAGADHRQSSGS